MRIGGPKVCPPPGAPKPGKFMILYARFCCLISITDDVAPDGSDVIATEDGAASARRLRFTSARVTPDGPWFRETPALAGHLRALRMRHHTADADAPGERLIDTAAACVYTGRARQVLYRWAREGRITRYGDAGTALWDVFELPAARRDGSTATPPRKG